MVKNHYVAGACNRSFNNLGNVNISRNGFNGNSVFFNYGGFAALVGCGQSNSSLFVGKNNNELAAFDLSAGVFRYCPSDSNVSVLSANCGELEVGVVSDDFGNLEFANGLVNLFLSSLNDQFDVLEAIGAHRNEVRSATVQNENTGSICFPSEVVSVSCIDFALLIYGKSGGEVGNVGANVRGYIIQFELKILGSVLIKFLTLDLNALNSYGETNIVSKRFAVCNLICDIESFNGFLVGVNDSCGTALDFLHAGVRSYGAGNFNGHTEFDAIVSDGVLCHAVAVVTALAFKVSEEEVVVLVASRLGVDSNNDTLNNNVVAFFCSHILFKAGQNILRNSEVEGLGSSLIAALNGSGQNVLELFGGLFIYVYDVGGVVLLFDGNLVGVNRPFNGVLNAGNSRYCSNLKVSCGNVLVLVEVVNVICSCIYVIHNLGLFFAKQIAEKIARCKGGYTESQGQQNY